jgi:HK97 family phage portal protein
MFNRVKQIFRAVKSAVYTGAAYLSLGPVSWPNRDFDNFAKEAYLKNLISYRCIDMIAKSVSSVPWSIKKVTADGDVEVLNHPFVSVMRRPNPMQSWQQWLYNTISYYLLDGNSFLLRVGPTSGVNQKTVRELYCLRPTQMKILKNENTNDITGYEYQKTANLILTYDIDPISGQCDVIHIKTFNPLDDVWGVSPVEPAAREIDTNNAAADWHKSLLDNQARPGMVLLFERNLSDTQYDRLSKDMRDKREGASNAGKTLILEGAKDVKPYGFSPSEMDFIEGNRDKARMIASAFGVPAQLLGIRGDQTFANFEQARTIFWEDTVIYYLNLIKAELNAWLFDNDEQIFLDYDVEDVPALAYRQEVKWKRANDASFITTNEKREMTGYGVVEGGDDILVQASLIPLGQEPEVPEESPVTEDDEDDFDDQSNE